MIFGHTGVIVDVFIIINPIRLISNQLEKKTISLLNAISKQRLFKNELVATINPDSALNKTNN